MVQNSHQNSQCEETTGSHNEQQCSRECFGQNCYVEQCAAADEFTHQTQTARAMVKPRPIPIPSNAEATGPFLEANASARARIRQFTTISGMYRPRDAFSAGR